MNCDDNLHELDPLEFLDETGKEDKLVLIILNQDFALTSEHENLSHNPYYKRFHRLWTRSAFKACVDGGTVHLDQINSLLANSSDDDTARYVPDLISGDFDSIEPTVLKRYEQLGSEVVSTPNQDETDFTKCVRIVGDRLRSDLAAMRPRHVVALVGKSERFDHSVSNVNTLFGARRLLPDWTRLQLLFPRSLMCLLVPGTSRISNSSGRYLGKWCSLMPVQRPAVVSTRGLVWDLNDSALSFGRIVMHSNRFRSDAREALVSTDNCLVFVVEVQSELCT